MLRWLGVHLCTAVMHSVQGSFPLVLVDSAVSCSVVCQSALKIRKQAWTGLTQIHEIRTLKCIQNRGSRPLISLLLSDIIFYWVFSSEIKLTKIQIHFPLSETMKSILTLTLRNRKKDPFLKMVEDCRMSLGVLSCISRAAWFWSGKSYSL